MVLLGHPILLWAVIGCSSSAIIILSILLVRFSLRDQSRALLRERLNFVKSDSKGDVKQPTILLRKDAILHQQKVNKVCEYFRTRLGIELNPKLAMALPIFLSVLIFACIAYYLFSGQYFGLILCVVILAISASAWCILKYRRDKFLLNCETQLPEMLDFVVRGLRAGHAFPTCIFLVGEELSAPLGPEFKRIFREQELGISLSSSLLILTQKIPLMDLKYFVTTYQINREIGGNLADVLDNIANLIRERFKLKMHVKALTAEGRMSAWVLSILPFAVALALSVVRPDYVGMLFNEPFGQKLILVALCLWSLGIIVIKRMINIDY